MANEQAPEILAPAGDENCFLAALAAGANGIYLGLKHFSARMEAENFSMRQLARLTSLAHTRECRVYVAMNTLVKPDEVEQAFRLVRRLARQTEVDGLIIQDPGMIDIARQADFRGSLALSTLANVSSPAGLRAARQLGVQRVIVPRELSLDELRAMGEQCPAGLELECFVQGALCYCVSGRCYWSSTLGGKSSLRGRCVQPCRRLYARQAGRKNAERHFSCQDLELGELAHKLLTVPNLKCWKIEGRKKGPHYVYHAVRAYAILRDNQADARSRRLAHDILQLALGRPGVQGRFLPQKNHFPMAPRGQTSSGLLAGHARIGQDGKCTISPHFPLLARDRLRIGVEDQPWHSTTTVSMSVPKGGSLTLKLPRHKTPKSGTPVYLIDRREPELQREIDRLKGELAKIPQIAVSDVPEKLSLPQPMPAQKLPSMLVSRFPQNERGPWPGPQIAGLWLNGRTAKTSRAQYKRTSFWLPPVIWPDDEGKYCQYIDHLLRGGASNFVCNAPWQRALFPDTTTATLIAGPFCNLANALAIEEMARLGFSAAFASPELSGAELQALATKSPLPLGLVTGGFWPVGLSRFGLAGIEPDEAFSSPRGEVFWARNYAGTIWLYPAWPLDLSGKKTELGGFSFFAQLDETPPPIAVKRPGQLNWECGLL